MRKAPKSLCEKTQPLAGSAANEAMGNNQIAGNGNININVGGAQETQAPQSSAQSASSAMSGFDPISVLSKVAEILKGVLGAASG